MTQYAHGAQVQQQGYQQQAAYVAQQQGYATQGVQVTPGAQVQTQQDPNAMLVFLDGKRKSLQSQLLSVGNNPPAVQQISNEINLVSQEINNIRQMFAPAQPSYIQQQNTQGVAVQMSGAVNHNAAAQYQQPAQVQYTPPSGTGYQVTQNPPVTVAAPVDNNVAGTRYGKHATKAQPKPYQPPVEEYRPEPVKPEPVAVKTYAERNTEPAEIEEFELETVENVKPFPGNEFELLAAPGIDIIKDIEGQYYKYVIQGKALDNPENTLFNKNTTVNKTDKPEIVNAELLSGNNALAMLATISHEKSVANICGEGNLTLYIPLPSEYSDKFSLELLGNDLLDIRDTLIAIAEKDDVDNIELEAVDRLDAYLVSLFNTHIGMNPALEFVIDSFIEDIGEVYDIITELETKDLARAAALRDALGEINKLLKYNNSVLKEKTESDVKGKYKVVTLNEKRAFLYVSALSIKKTLTDMEDGKVFCVSTYAAPALCAVLDKTYSTSSMFKTTKRLTLISDKGNEYIVIRAGDQYNIKKV